MLYTASFYEPRHWVGVRYRISRAHPRGRRTEWEVQPSLYPSRALLTEYRCGDLDFAALDIRYREELDSTFEKDVGFRAFLEELQGAGDVTLLCFEPEGTPCHRRSAAAWLLERVPGLELGRLR
jgi:uncharacterized protein YeaO (DUF488 family)